MDLLLNITLFLLKVHIWSSTQSLLLVNLKLSFFLKINKISRHKSQFYVKILLINVSNVSLFLFISHSNQFEELLSLFESSARRFLYLR